MFRFRLLGDVAVHGPVGRIDIGARRHQKLLAMLLINANSVVPLAQLIDVLWDETPPPTAREQVTNSVAMIRRRLLAAGAPASLIVRRPGGVQLCRMPSVEIDLDLLAALTTSAAQATSPAQATPFLRQAVGLWRGPTLAGLDGEVLRATAAYFDERRLNLLEQCLAAELEIRAPEELVPELTALVAAHPYREHFVAQLMRALNESGRRADALSVFRSLVLRLRDELGIGVSTELNTLHREILRENQDSENTTAHRPRHLPPNASFFEGRVDALTVLDRLTSHDPGSPLPAVIITGMGGVGKTALAVRWALAAANRFPDGQLYVNMHGYDRHSALTPLQALTKLLSVLGVPDDRIPADEETASAFYRSLVVNRRMIILLDNVHIVDQVRPLLVAGSTAAIVVTSRSKLLGLVARDGASVLPLDPFTPEESRALLVRLLAARRHDDQRAYAELAQSCGHLPLALRIAAAMLSTDSRRPVEDLVGVLGNGIGAFDVPDDQDTALGVLFGHSYTSLPPAQAAMLRLMAAAPAIDYTAVTAAAAAHVTTAEAAMTLAALASFSLLTESGVGRYGYHDLLRDYAAAQATPAEQATATERVIDVYVQIAAHTEAVISGPAAQNFPPVPRTLDPADLPTDREAMLPLVDTEMRNILAVSRAAVIAGRPEAGWLIPYLLWTYLDRGRNVGSAIELSRAAVDAAVAAGDDVAERRVSILLGTHLNHARRCAESLGPLNRALDIARSQALPLSEARIINIIGVAYKNLHRWDEALEAWHTVLRLGEEHKDDGIVFPPLLNIGAVYTILGDFEQAHGYFNRAAELSSLYDLSPGLIHHHLGWLANERGRHDDAAHHLGLALDCAVETGDRRMELATRIEIARAYTGSGNPAAALAALELALEVSRHVSNPHDEAKILGALAKSHLNAGSPARGRRYLAQATRARLLAPDFTEQQQLDKLRAEFDS